MEKKVNMRNPVFSNKFRHLANSDASAVICTGAPSGGLESLEGFFSHVLIPCKTAFFVTQNLDPASKSIMTYFTQEDVAGGVGVIFFSMVAAKNLGNDLHALRPGE